MLRFVYLIFALMLTACASSETRSIVSKDDIPASKYKQIVVFIENLDDAERSPAEQIVVSTLQKAGVNAVDGTRMLKGRGNLSEKAKARLVQKEFDAVLYLTVEQKGIVEQLVPNAYYDGQMVNFNMMGIVTVGHNATDMYITKPDGTVYQPMLALKTKVDIQDTKSTKLVWTSETISSGHAKVTNLAALFTQTSDQIIAKMREDNAI